MIRDLSASILRNQQLAAANKAELESLRLSYGGYPPDRGTEDRAAYDRIQKKMNSQLARAREITAQLSDLQAQDDDFDMNVGLQTQEIGSQAGAPYAFTPGTLYNQIGYAPGVFMSRESAFPPRPAYGTVMFSPYVEQVASSSRTAQQDYFGGQLHNRQQPSFEEQQAYLASQRSYQEEEQRYYDMQQQWNEEQPGDHGGQYLHDDEESLSDTRSAILRAPDFAASGRAMCEKDCLCWVCRSE